jgi:hypothetical protein
MNRVRLLLCLLSALLLASPAFAEDSAPAPQLYQIELILFRHADAVAVDAWPGSQRSRVPRNARALQPLDAEGAAPGNFHRVAPRHYLLSRTWQRLQGLGDTVPALHLAWRQSHGLLRNGRRVRLDDEIDGLSGYLALRLGNRLVAEIDITLDQDGMAIGEQEAFASASPWDAAEEQSIDPAPAPPRQGFRLHQRRTLRLGENHYFDHPAFGVLLRVERVEPEAS